MRTPGKFGIAKELNPEERFIQMEKNYSGIIERIQAYDKVLEDFDKILKAQSSLVSENALLKKSLEDAQAFISSINNRLLLANQDLNKSVQVINDRLGSNEKESQTMKSWLLKSESNLSSLIESKHAAAMNSLQGYVKNETLNSVKQPLCNAVDSLNEEINKLHESLEKRVDKDLDLEEKLQKLSYSHDLAQNKLNSAQYDLEAHKKDTGFMVASLRKQIENEVANVKDQVVTYMDNTKVEMIGSPGSLESVQRSIANRLDSITLDGSNAVLKSNNNEQQIKILEKKLENLAILMKKNEFAKM